MRVKRALAGTLLLCSACFYLHPLPAQTLLVPAKGLKPQSSEISTPARDEQLKTPDQGIPSADIAFGFKALVETGGVLFDWTIQPGYYLYQSKLAFSDSEGRRFTVALPQAASIVDEFVGESLVYYDSLQVRLPLAELARKQPPDYSLTVVFQGCAKDRYCYPPQTRTIALNRP